MSQKVAVKVTPEGIMVSHPIVDDWGEAPDLEIEQIADALVIRPRTNHAHQSHERVVNEMRAAGLVEDLPWTQPPIVSPEKRARLAEKLGRGRPLSELILEERDEIA